jgi:hypothetical protein
VSALRQRHIPWHSLSKRNQERMLMLIASLHEFHQGAILCGLQAHQNSSAVDPTMRFLRNSLFVYFHGYYCARGAALLPIIREVGRPDLADSIEKILDRDVGSITFGELISRQRNKGVAHQLFDFRSHSSILKGDPASMARAFSHLQRRTIGLHVLLRKLYPVASEVLDDAYMRPGLRRR